MVRGGGGGAPPPLNLLLHKLKFHIFCGNHQTDMKPTEILTFFFFYFPGKNLDCDNIQCSGEKTLDRDTCECCGSGECWELNQMEEIACSSAGHILCSCVIFVANTALMMLK